MEKISVIIPVYNVELYIKQCLESVINQSYKNLEIILVDDGSTDNSYNICDKYAEADGRVKVYHRKNFGVSSSRNYGLSMSTGEYIFFLDSDDYIRNDTLEILLDYIREYKLDFVIGGYTKSPDEILTEISPYSFINVSKMDILNYMITKDDVIATIWGKLYTKKIVEKIFFDESMTFAEDMNYFLDVVKNSKKIGFDKSCFYYYRQINISSVRSKYNKDKFNRINIIEKYIDYIKENNNNQIPFSATNIYYIKSILNEYSMVILWKSDKKWEIIDKLRSQIINNVSASVNYDFKIRIKIFLIRYNLIFIYKILTKAKSHAEH